MKRWIFVALASISVLLATLAVQSSVERAANAAGPGGLLAELGGGSANDDAQEIALSTRLVARETPGGATGTLSVTARLGADWHIYSLTQPAGGGKPTQIVVDRSSQFELTGPFVPDRDPRQRYSEQFPGVALQEHYDEVTWTAPIRFAPQVDAATVRISGTLSGLVCRDTAPGGCIPVNERFAASLAGVDATPEALPIAPFVASEATPALFNAPESQPVAPAAAPVGPSVPEVETAPGPFTDEDGHVTIKGEITPGAIAPGGKAELKITITPAAGYHVYPWAERDPKKGASKPTLILVAEAAGLTIGKPATASPIIDGKPFEPGEPPQKYHSGAATWTLSIDVPATATPGKHELVGLIGYQVCTEKSCDAPGGLVFKAPVTVGVGPAGAVALEFGKTRYTAVSKYAAGLAPPPPAPAATRAESDGSLIITEANSVESSSLFFILGVSFIGGFILNLMPCVLPVIGLKLLSFAEQGGQSRAQVFMLNVWYSLGLLSVFWVLAALAIFLNFGWGQQFQSTWFNVLLAGLVFAMGLSFLGVWEIPLPGFVSDTAGELSEHNEGAAGAFIKGAIATVIATPCSGPFLGAVFGFTLDKPPLVIAMVFTAIGLGMASPFLVVGALPEMIRFLPKPGEWMVTFKQVMGFILMGSVVFLVASIDKNYTIATLTLLVGLGLACWMIGRTSITAEWDEQFRSWGTATGVAIAVGTLAFWQLGPNEAELPWKQFDSQAVASLQAEGKTVLIDFTAEWCGTCKWNLKTAVNTRNVKDLVQRNSVVPMIADWTNGDEDVTDMLRLLKSKSVPVLAIFPAGKPGEVIVLRDTVVESQVIHWLEQAGPSRDAAGRNSVAMLPSGN